MVWPRGAFRLSRILATLPMLDAVAVARSYLRSLRALDAGAVAALFTPEGVLDDGVGGHHAGPDAIARFVGSLRMKLVIEEVALLEAPGRVTVFGYLGSDQAEKAPFRWVFHLEGDRIAHLGNSYLRAFPDGIGTSTPP